MIDCLVLRERVVSAADVGRMPLPQVRYWFGRLVDLKIVKLK